MGTISYSQDNIDNQDDTPYYATDKTLVNGNYYIFDDNVQMITNHWVVLDDGYYYFCQNDGIVATSTWIEDYYYLDGEGRLVLYLDDIGTYTIEMASCGDKVYKLDDLESIGYSDMTLEVTMQGTVIVTLDGESIECIISGQTIIEDGKYIYPFYIFDGYAAIAIEGDDDDIYFYFTIVK